MHCPVIQGYGLTETTAAAFLAVPDVYEHIGSVGLPLPATCVRLESVPELGYDALGYPPTGEVLVNSSHNLLGYYKDPDLTKEALTDDGWFHTRDIGQIKVHLFNLRTWLINSIHGDPTYCIHG